MSCGAYSTMQTARTVEEKHGEISLNLFSPRGFIDAITQVVDKDHDNYFTLPYIQVSGKYGITDQIDAGINLNTYGQMGLEGKYMLVGDHNSLFSLSPGLSFNTFFFYFYEGLKELDLSGKIYGCLGSGEAFYGNFCKSVDDFDERFQLTKAIRGADVVKIEENAKDEDRLNIDRFAQQLVEISCQSN